MKGPLYYYGLISCNLFDVNVRGGDVVIKLQKVHEPFWANLSQSKTQPPFMNIDHEHWQDSSDNMKLNILLRVVIY